MNAIAKALCWGGALIALAFANRFGLIADKDAGVMFAVIPALWVASGGLGQCLPRRTGQGAA